MDAGVIHLPKFAPGGVGARRPKAGVPAGGGVGHLAEDDAVADLVEIDADEVGFLGQFLGVADHVIQARRTGDGERAAGSTAPDAEFVPGKVEKILAEKAVAAGIDLDDFDALVENKEADVAG